MKWDHVNMKKQYQQSMMRRCKFTILILLTSSSPLFSAVDDIRFDRLTTSKTIYEIGQPIDVMLEAEKFAPEGKLILDKSIVCEDKLDRDQSTAITVPDSSVNKEHASQGATRAPGVAALTVVFYRDCPLAFVAGELAGKHELCYQDPSNPEGVCASFELQIPAGMKPDQKVDFPRVNFDWTKIHRPLDLPPKNPGAWEEEIRTTLEQTEFVKTLGNSIPQEHQKAYEKRLNILKELVLTKHGTQVLLSYWLDHPKSAYVLQFLISSNDSFLKRYPEMQYEPDFSRFLNTFTQLDTVFVAEDLIRALTFESVLKYKNVWHAWLARVNPNKLSRLPEGYKSPDDTFLESSCIALTDIWDPTAVDAVANILKQASHTRSGQPCYAYLARMGDPRIAEILANSGDLCNLDNFINVADDLVLPSIYPKVSCKWPLRVDPRPDLMRGAARVIFLTPGNTTLTDPTKPSWYYPAVQQASAILTPEEILRQCQEAESRGDTILLQALILELAEKQSSAGNADLLRWLERDPADQVSYAAGNVLVRRLIGNNRKPLLSLLSQMDTEQRGEVVFRILASSAKFPQVDFPSKNWGVEDHGVMLARDIGYFFSPITARNWDATFLRKFEPLLLDWIGWTKSPTALSTTYALMTSEEANRRFLALLASGATLPVQDAWLYGKNPAKSLLMKLQEKYTKDDRTSKFLLLLLSKEGNRPAYDAIREMLLRDDASKESEFFLPFLQEIVRWQDWRLLHDLYLLAADRSTGQDSYYWKARMVETLALLIKERPDFVHEVLYSGGYSKIPPLDVMLQAIIKAKTPRSEEFLRGYQNRVDEQRASDPTISNLWVSALRLIDTPWCRDTLLYERQKELNPGNGRVATIRPQEQIENALREGAISQALDYAGDQIRKRGVVGGSTLQMSDWSQFRKGLIAFFPSAKFEERIWIAFHIGMQLQAWPDQLVDMALRDQAGPVRVTVLQYLLLHPDNRYSETIRKIAETDPYPWCRRLAREILLFPIDPLQPERGTSFDLRAYGYY